HFDHARDMARFSRSREFIGMLEPQGVEILEEGFFEWLGVLLERDVGLAGTANCFIIDIGQIHHPVDAIAPRLQMPLQQIFENVSAKVADMSPAVNGRSASVDGNIRRIERNEFAHFPGVGIKEPCWHTRPAKNGAPIYLSAT